MGKSESHLSVSITVRRFYCFAASLAALALMLGSWAPFRFREATLESAWSELLANVSRTYSHTDFVANILVGIPLAFFALGFLLACRPHSPQRVLLALAGAASLCTAVSVTCEVGQAWIFDRVPTIRDVGAQLVGAGVGAVLWLLVGGQCTKAIWQILGPDPLFVRIQALVALSSAAAVVWIILPLDLALSPTDLARKWTREEIELVPFSIIRNGLWQSMLSWAASGLIAIPLGCQCLLSLRRFSEFRPRFSTVALLSVCVGVIPELLQIPIAGRVSSATDALFGSLGAGAGIGLALAFTKQLDDPEVYVERQLWRRSSFWFLLSIAYGAILAFVSWYPFDFVHDPTMVRALFKEIVAEPFADYRGSNLRGLFVCIRLAVASAVLGVFSGIGCVLIDHLPLRRSAMVLLVLLSVLASLIIELGQLLEPSHSGAGIGFIVRSSATTFGLALGWMLFAPRRKQPT